MPLAVGGRGSACTCVINCVGLKDFHAWLRLGSHSPMKFFTGLRWPRCRPARRSPKEHAPCETLPRVAFIARTLDYPRLWAWLCSPGHSLRAEAGSILGRIDCCCCASIALGWCGHDSGVMKTASVIPTFRASHCALRNRYVHGAGGVFHDYISVLEIASGRSCIGSTGGVTAVRYVLLTAFLGSDTRLG
jgi:hypothetical protein